MNKKYLDLLPEKKRKELDARLKEFDEEHKQFLPGFFSSIKYLIYSLILLVIVSPLWKIAYGPIASGAITYLLMTLTEAFMYLCFVVLLIELIIMFINFVRREKIKREYFEVIVKPKVRKK